jgi:hypothetical protein
MQTVAPEPPSHEITPESVYLRRREFPKTARPWTIEVTGGVAGGACDHLDKVLDTSTGVRAMAAFASACVRRGSPAAIHFIWRVKIDVSQPLTYATVLATLLLVRVLFWVAGHRARLLAHDQKGRTLPA